MIANALLFAFAGFLAVAFYLMGALRFLAPYRPAILHLYGVEIAIYAAMLAINLYAIAFFLGRKFFLKDPGGKLTHADRDLQSERELAAALAGRTGDMR